jgi:hypothetical protein
MCGLGAKTVVGQRKCNIKGVRGRVGKIFFQSDYAQCFAALAELPAEKVCLAE